MPPNENRNGSWAAISIFHDWDERVTLPLKKIKEVLLLVEHYSPID